MTVFAPGAFVWIAGLQAFVKEVLLLEGAVRYNLSWWSNGEHHTGWFEASEVLHIKSFDDRDISTTLEIGFHSSTDPNPRS